MKAVLKFASGEVKITELPTTFALQNIVHDEPLMFFGLQFIDAKGTAFYVEKRAKINEL